MYETTAYTVLVPHGLVGKFYPDGGSRDAVTVASVAACGYDCDKIINSGLLPQLLDIVYSIEINSYRGRSNVQLILKDFRFAK